MVNNLINNLFADFIHVAKVMNYTYNAKLLQKSGIRKNEVIELIYRGFI